VHDPPPVHPPPHPSPAATATSSRARAHYNSPRAAHRCAVCPLPDHSPSMRSRSPAGCSGLLLDPSLRDTTRADAEVGRGGRLLAAFGQLQGDRRGRSWATTPVARARGPAIVQWEVDGDEAPTAKRSTCTATGSSSPEEVNTQTPQKVRAGPRASRHQGRREDGHKGKWLYHCNVRGPMNEARMIGIYRVCAAGSQRLRRVGDHGRSPVVRGWRGVARL